MWLVFPQIDLHPSDNCTLRRYSHHLHDSEITFL